VQSEYSLCTRNPEIAVLEACREIGAAFVAFSPLGRGFLAGALLDVTCLETQDIRRSMPRFEAQHHALNLKLQERFAALAQELDHSPAQLALAWLLSRGSHVIALPGTTRNAHLEDNLRAAAVSLAPDAAARLDALINQHTISGNRYSAATQAEIDTENFS
jgi:aryl-alcohol dehydrogenase-like predicted oxidoreductase